MKAGTTSYVPPDNTFRYPKAICPPLEYGAPKRALALTVRMNVNTVYKSCKREGEVRRR